MSVIYVLLVAHFVGDFICQSDWMALNMSRRWDALAVHVAAYTAVVGAIVAVWYSATGRGALPVAEQMFWPWIAANVAAHFAQDAITSRINSRLLHPNQRHWFFVGIGADQLLHYVTLFVTAGWWLR